MVSHSKLIVETLTQARALIASPAKWTRGVNARNNKGDRINWDNPRAARFCALGALKRASQQVDAQRSLYSARQSMQKIIEEISDYSGIIEYNDSHKHADVVRVFDDAIGYAEAQQEDLC